MSKYVLKCEGLCEAFYVCSDGVLSPDQRDAKKFRSKKTALGAAQIGERVVRLVKKGGGK